MALPTRTHSKKTKRGITLVHDTPYEAAYSAFRLALQAHCGEGVACWVDAEDIDIQRHSANGPSGQAAGTAKYKTMTEDGQRVGKSKPCDWTVKWQLAEDSRGLPRTDLTDYTIT